MSAAERGAAAGPAAAGPPKPQPPPPAASGSGPGSSKPRPAKRQRRLAPLPADGSRKAGACNGYKELDPGQHTLSGGGRILYQPNFMPPAAAAELFAAVKEQLQWQQRPVKVMGRTVMQPRLIAYQADGSELAVSVGQRRQALSSCCFEARRG